MQVDGPMKNKTKTKLDYDSVYVEFTNDEKFLPDYFNFCCNKLINLDIEQNLQEFIHFIQETINSLNKSEINYNIVTKVVSSLNVFGFLISHIKEQLRPYTKLLSYILLHIMKIPPEFRYDLLSDELLLDLLSLLSVPTNEDHLNSVIYILQAIQRALCCPCFSDECVSQSISTLSEFFDVNMSFPQILCEILNIYAAICVIQTNYINNEYFLLVLTKCRACCHLKETKDGVYYALASVLTQNPELGNLIIENQTLPILFSNEENLNDASIAFLDIAFQCDSNFVSNFAPNLNWTLITNAIYDRQTTIRMARLIKIIIKNNPNCITFLETTGVFAALSSMAKESDFNTSSFCMSAISKAADYLTLDAILSMVQTGFVSSLGSVMSLSDAPEKYLPLLARILHFANSALGSDAITVINEYDDAQIDDILEEIGENIEPIQEMAQNLRNYSNQLEN